MAQIIKLKRSLTAGSKPTTSNLGEGELAMNVTDGKLFLRKSGSAGDNIKEVVTLDHDGTLSGSLNITGSITASAFAGDGSRLTNITVSQNATVKQTFTNALGVFSQSAQVALSGDVTGTAAATVIGTVDGDTF